MTKSIKRVFLILIYLIVLALLYVMIRPVFTIDDPPSKVMFQEFYQEPENTLDAIYIGPSSVYAYWKAPYAFKQYGITVYGLSTGAMPVGSIRYMIEESLKTQDPSLFIVDVRSFLIPTTNSTNFFHQITDSMKPSLTKFQMIEDVSASMNLKGKDKLEFYFPIIRFHSRWTQLKSTDFSISDVYYKGVPNITTTRLKEPAEPCFTDQSQELISPNETYLRELLATCKEKNLNVLFVASPFLENENGQKMLNRIGNIISDYGYPFLNFNNTEDFSAMGLEPMEDFRDTDHTNIWGSIKFTDYFGAYLKETYQLPDRRNDAVYTSWYQAYENLWKSVDAASHSAADMMDKTPA